MACWRKPNTGGKVLGFIVEKIAEFIAGRPGGARWAYVTALFGWSAAAALLTGLGATVFGADAIASGALSVFAFCVVIAFSLDWTRLFR